MEIVSFSGGFYLRSDWRTKTVDAVKEDNIIFSPDNKHATVGNIGLVRVIIKALRY